jgi:hypothetical protein
VVAHVGPAAFFKWEFDQTKSPPKPPPLASLAPSLSDRGPWAVRPLPQTGLRLCFRLGTETTPCVKWELESNQAAPNSKRERRG